jgi:RimJ/RimL family protein N-acetyltransferase
MEPFELSDGVVLLRVPDATDVDRVTTLCQDPAIQEWTTVPSPYARSDAEGFLTRLVPDGWARGTQWNWSVREADGERLVGMVGLARGDDGAAELGYWLAPGARGRGLMGRAVALVVATAFGRLGLGRLTWRAFVGNGPSRRVAERAGFRVEDGWRAGDHRGTPRDEWHGELLRADAVSEMMGR